MGPTQSDNSVEVIEDEEDLKLIDVSKLGDFERFQILLCDHLDWNQSPFFGQVIFGKKQGTYIKKKLLALKKLEPDVFKKVMRKMSKEFLRELFCRFLEIHKSRQDDENEEEKNTIMKWKDLSRNSKIENLVAFFQGRELLVEKRSLEEEYVSESFDEVKNIFVTFEMKNGKTFQLPKHLIIRIFSFFQYDKHLLYKIGSVCKDFYLVILSTWRRIRISPKIVFGISLLALKNVSEISFTKKSISLSKEELGYVWGHITPESIRKFDLAKCPDGVTKFFKSLLNFKIIFDRCEVLVLPDRFSKSQKLFKEIPGFKCFPNIRSLHLSSNSIPGLANSENKFLFLKEIHLTIPQRMGIQYQETTEKGLRLLKTWKFTGQELSSICVHPEDVRLLSISLREPITTKERLNELFSNMLKDFQQIDTFRLSINSKWQSESISKGFSLFPSGELPLNLKVIEIFHENFIHGNAPTFPMAIKNPSCEKISFFSVDSKHADSTTLFDSILTWEPVPSNINVGVIFINAVVMGDKEFKSFVAWCVRLIGSIDKKGSFENFRIMAYSNHFSNSKKNMEVIYKKGFSGRIKPVDNYFALEYSWKKKKLTIFGPYLNVKLADVFLPLQEAIEKCLEIEVIVMDGVASRERFEEIEKMLRKVIIPSSKDIFESAHAVLFDQLTFVRKMN